MKIFTVQFYPVSLILSSLRTTLILSTLFSNIRRLCPVFNATDQVSHLYKTGKVFLHDHPL